MKLSSLQKGLVGHWTMAQDSLKGSLLADKTPYENDGTIYGATFTTDRMGKANSAMSFDGTNNYIDCGNNSSLNIKNEITLSAWVFVRDFTKTYSGIISTGLGIVNQSYSLQIREANNVMVFVRADGSVWNGVTANNLLSDAWIHVVGVDNGSKQSIYIDGVKRNESNSLGVIVNIAYVAIGKYSISLDGLIDDVRIYNRALSQEEIILLYNSYNPKIIL